MNPKSGKAGTPVNPAEPKAAEEADKADPGEVEEAKAEQRQTQTGKYGATKVKPHRPPQTDEEKEQKKSWIEIKLLDMQGRPVPGEPFKVILPDGETAAEGTLDEKGFARVNGTEPGSCTVSFPRLDQTAWRSK